MFLINVRRLNPPYLNLNEDVWLNVSDMNRKSGQIDDT